MTTVPVVLSLGSNLGDRRVHIRRAVNALRGSVRVVRLSSLWETEPIDAPDGSPHYLNAVLAGYTALEPRELLGVTSRIELGQGRRRRHRNEPRPIDVDIVFYGSTMIRTHLLTLPHPRYHDRAFVTEPLRELGLGWIDPVDGLPVTRWSGAGQVVRCGAVLVR